MFMPKRILEEKLRLMVADDVGKGDITSEAIVPAELIAEAVVLAKETGVVAGIKEIVILAESLGLDIKTKVADGEEIKNGIVILRICGNARNILLAERTMLNLLSRMSGIATKTRRLTEKLRKAKLKAKIAATRKTAPGLLYFDKKAVLVGGGDPHRLRLDDMILVKDNHIAIAGSIKAAIEKAKFAKLSKRLEVEVRSTSDALKAAEWGVDIVMLDNFSPKQINRAVEALEKAGLLGKIILEVSGGITEQNLMEYASAQVDVISMGAVTHSAKALDMSLEIVKIK
jgi:nicotinate-nucleotide pyrophosphorylase (carboxylating)